MIHTILYRFSLSLHACRNSCEAIALALEMYKEQLYTRHIQNLRPYPQLLESFIARTKLLDEADKETKMVTEGRLARACV